MEENQPNLHITSHQKKEDHVVVVQKGVCQLVAYGHPKESAYSTHGTTARLLNADSQYHINTVAFLAVGVSSRASNGSQSDSVHCVHLHPPSLLLVIPGIGTAVGLRSLRSRSVLLLSCVGF